jgi:hypothetical protein
VPLQLPGWGPAPAAGEFVALVWGGSKDVAEWPKLGVKLPVCADAAPEGSLLYGIVGDGVAVLAAVSQAALPTIPVTCVQSFVLVPVPPLP